ncbi:MAG: ATP-binding cassette domain-containing protein [Actinomycetota bacterium]
MTIAYDAGLADRRLASRAKGHLRVKDVSFRDRSGDVLSYVSFDVDPGSTTFLVTSSHRQQAVLLGLLLGIHRAPTGSITVDGEEVTDRDLPRLRRQVAIALRDPWIVTGTVAENIGFELPGIHRSDVEKAARLACLDLVAHRWSDGLDTQIDPDDGDLGLVERRLIALARALARQPELLLIEDPTAGLDAVDETLMIRALHRIRGVHTTLVATRRRHLAHDADQIVSFQGPGILVDTAEAEPSLTGVPFPVAGVEPDPFAPETPDLTRSRPVEPAASTTPAPSNDAAPLRRPRPEPAITPTLTREIVPDTDANTDTDTDTGREPVPAPAAATAIPVATGNDQATDAVTGRGRKLGDRIAITHVIDRSSWSETWEGWDRHAEVPVRLKVPRTRPASPAVIERLRNEHDLARRLRHPGLARPLTIDLDATVPFAAFEHVSGPTLADLTGPGAPTSELRAVLRAVYEVARTLTFIHNRGYVHLDLRPELVVLSHQGTVITDTGHARRIGEDAGRCFSPSEYTSLAAEQLRGAPAHPAMDMFALGAMLFHAMSGRVDESGRLARHLQSVPDDALDRVVGPHERPPRRRPLAEVGEELRPRTATERIVDQLIERLTASDPRRRPTAAETMSIMRPLIVPQPVAVAAG